MLIYLKYYEQTKLYFVYCNSIYDMHINGNIKEKSVNCNYSANKVFQGFQDKALKS